MNEQISEWNDFHQRTLGRPAREMLRRVLGCIELRGGACGVAVDLGCGSGAETLELLRRGWQVHAVDADLGGLGLLVDAVPPSLLESLNTHHASIEAFDIPPCDLIWAGNSLPFCKTSSTKAYWDQLVSALNPGGCFAGDFFGPQHDWANRPDVNVLSERALRRQLSKLHIEAFDTENSLRVSGNQLTRWHAFAVVAGKAMVAT